MEIKGLNIYEKTLIKIFLRKSYEDLDNNNPYKKELGFIIKKFER